MGFLPVEKPCDPLLRSVRGLRRSQPGRIGRYDTKSLRIMALHRMLEGDFEELGDAPNPNVTVLTGNSPDGVNSLVWIEDDNWSLGKWVLGVTGPIITQDGSLVEADIAFNGLHLTWTTDGNGGTDLESVAVHEIGHMFGMQHNLGPYNWAEPPTMTPNIQPKLKSRTPEWDDQMCACFTPKAGFGIANRIASVPRSWGKLRMDKTHISVRLSAKTRIRPVSTLRFG